MKAGPRACVAPRGAPEETAAAAREVIARLEPAAVLWVGGEAPPGVRAISLREVAALLGQSFDAVVLDLHEGLDADVIGQVHGFVRGDGALVLRLPIGPPTRGRERLAAYPHTADEVGGRLFARLERALADARIAAAAAPIAPPSRETRGTAEQAEVVARLVAILAGPAGGIAALTADRGRGKSAALGLAVSELARRGRRVLVTAADEAAVLEVLRFADGAARFVPLVDLIADDPPDCDAIVVDEAAQVPVPLLRRLVHRHRARRLAFATTVRGYEGTGRGFALRFLAGLEREGRDVSRLTLAEPIRWAQGDPLERLVFDALLLAADPAPVGPASGREASSERAVSAPEALDRDRLAAREIDLADLFGLLVHAHYRTTPSDLHRLLDAPNLGLHAIRVDGRIAAACLVAREGALAAELTADVASGRVRLRAHALADALVAHLGRRDAGPLTMIRSVRIAVHPSLRRLGLARRLVEHVHASYAPDLFGTLFGATADLLAFRREVGYALVRVSASRGARTGEPSVLMLRPASPAGQALVADLRQDLARDLPIQLELLTSDRELVLEEELTAALLADLPAVARRDEAARDALVLAYAREPRTFESVAAAVSAWVEAHPHRLAALDPSARAVIEARVRQRRSWADAARAAGLASPKVAMRALRRAVRALVDRA